MWFRIQCQPLVTYLTLWDVQPNIEHERKMPTGYILQLQLLKMPDQSIDMKIVEPLKVTAIVTALFISTQLFFFLSYIPRIYQFRYGFGEYIQIESVAQSRSTICLVIESQSTSVLWWIINLFARVLYQAQQKMIKIMSLLYCFSKQNKYWTFYQSFEPFSISFIRCSHV